MSEKLEQLKGMEVTEAACYAVERLSEMPENTLEQRTIATLFGISLRTLYKEPDPLISLDDIARVWANLERTVRSVRVIPPVNNGPHSPGFSAR